jgi:hypothetical protein
LDPLHATATEAILSLARSERSAGELERTERSVKEFLSAKGATDIQWTTIKEADKRLTPKMETTEQKTEVISASSRHFECYGDVSTTMV